MTPFERSARYKPGIRPGIYRHYKGGLYFVPGLVAIDEATAEPTVLYYSLAMRVWIHREHASFTSTVTLEGPCSADPLDHGRQRIVRARFERLDRKQLAEEALSIGKLVVALSTLTIASIPWRRIR